MNKVKTTDIATWEGEGGATPDPLAAVPAMPDNWISPGTTFIERITHLPKALVLEEGSDANGWAVVKGPASGYEKALHNVGWTLFFMAGEIEVTVLGSGPGKLRTALQRLIVKAKSQRCNGLEITQVAKRSFLGVPYLYVAAHPRHLQEGLLFAGRN
jgi:hypothetical protein